jgi:hypothetical protein
MPEVDSNTVGVVPNHDEAPIGGSRNRHSSPLARTANSSGAFFISPVARQSNLSPKLERLCRPSGKGRFAFTTNAGGNATVEADGKDKLAITIVYPSGFVTEGGFAREAQK